MPPPKITVPVPDSIIPVLQPKGKDTAKKKKRREVTEEEREGEWLTAMEIFNYLQQKTRDKLSVSKIGHFGRSLKKLDIPCKKTNRGTVYHLVRLG